MVGEPSSQHRSYRFLDSGPDQGMSVAFVHLHRFLLDVGHLTFHVQLFPVLSNDGLQSGSVLNPLDQTSVATERHNRVGAQLQISFARLAVVLKHFVAEDCKIDEPLFFP